MITSLKHEQTSSYGKDGGLLTSCLFWSWNCPNGGTHPLRLDWGYTFLSQQHLQALGSEGHMLQKWGLPAAFSFIELPLPFILTWCRIHDYVQNRIVWELKVNFSLLLVWNLTSLLSCPKFCWHLYSLLRVQGLLKFLRCRLNTMLLCYLIFFTSQNRII